MTFHSFDPVGFAIFANPAPTPFQFLKYTRPMLIGVVVCSFVWSLLLLRRKAAGGGGAKVDWLGWTEGSAQIL
jgi:hypothetical protein